MIARALVVLCVLLGVARADPKPIVALLPLDAPAQLEIYGQPVASEIARALKGADIEVVVVGAKMAVPEKAILIVDGTMAQKGDDIALALRVRRRSDGVVLDDSVKSTKPLADLDRAASELSAKLLPVVRAKLAPPPEPPPKGVTIDHPHHYDDGPGPGPFHATPHQFELVIGSIASSSAETMEVEPLRAALAKSTADWASAHALVAKPGEGAQLSAKLAMKTVENAQADLAIGFEVASFSTTSERGVPVGHARVRVRIANAQKILFDRVVVTDTVVGDKKIDDLAARTAREVLAILRPAFAKVGLPR